MLRKLLPSDLASLKKAVSNPRAAVDQAFDESPLAPMRAFWNTLREMEVWWPVLIPVLLLVFWRTYQRERAALGTERDQP